ncbi:MAG: hypothetical protein EHM72_15395 [Calditrichaeota bacterium]|nr:MAG: hypothetical protein EHM72_15395 [Calditrichota bacterium]
MKSSYVKEKYNNLYVRIDFERRGLFQLIQQKFKPVEVLYPGCSIHVTPAFYFPHVCFVDHDPAAVDFFNHQKELFDLVEYHRIYRQHPTFHFINQSFMQPLSFEGRRFDLLLALFAGGVIKACKGYVKKGGLVLSNNHQQDALDAFDDHELSLIAFIRYQNKQYNMLQTTEHFKPSEIRDRHSHHYLRKTSRGEEYIENEVYYLFQKQ